jgi:hypothetical protein
MILVSEVGGRSQFLLAFLLGSTEKRNLDFSLYFVVDRCTSL